MIYQKQKIVRVLFLGFVVGVFGFSLYVFLTTENTIIVVNEAAQEAQEVVIEGNELPLVELESPAQPKSRIRIQETEVGFLNVRADASLEAKRIGRVKPGEVYEYTEIKDNWYHIVHPDFENAWVSGEYVEIVDQTSDLLEDRTYVLSS